MRELFENILYIASEHGLSESYVNNVFAHMVKVSEAMEPLKK